MIDWDPVIRAHRAREVGRLRAGRQLAISADRAWRAVVAASAPFRLGTRFRAVPDVRLYTGDALVASPGDRLPGPDDRSLDDYVARIAGPTGAGGFQLVVTDPLVIDFALWAEVRDLLRGLLARIGAPVLPVVGELVLGTFACTPRGFTKRMHCAVVTVVLAGRLRTRIWHRLWQRSPSEIRDLDAHRPDQVVTARAGDVLYWPADRWHLDEALAPCLALRLWIPAVGRDTAAEIAQVVSALAAERLGDGGDVPYLALAPHGPTGAVPAELARAGRLIGALARGPALPRELAIRWARRVSACGLEPVPAARAIALPDTARLRRDPGTPIVRMRWRGESIWAANGHAFTLRRGERALHRIVRGLERRGATLATLCDGDPGVRAALELLAEARAITVAGDGSP
ncbi:MAG TPA: hypothetical protein VHW23_22865 [Kofleriaceae bacterium]|jgi:hypothetical protein|nr:hypothetical protein [Kofleriaceae bacterium]